MSGSSSDTATLETAAAEAEVAENIRKAMRRRPISPWIVLHGSYRESELPERVRYITEGRGWNRAEGTKEFSIVHAPTAAGRAALVDDILWDDDVEDEAVAYLAKSSRRTLAEALDLMNYGKGFLGWF